MQNKTKTTEQMSKLLEGTWPKAPCIYENLIRKVRQCMLLTLAKVGQSQEELGVLGKLGLNSESLPQNKTKNLCRHDPVVRTLVALAEDGGLLLNYLFSISWESNVLFFIPWACGAHKCTQAYRQAKVIHIK